MAKGIILFCKYTISERDNLIKVFFTLTLLIVLLLHMSLNTPALLYYYFSVKNNNNTTNGHVLRFCYGK
jgi:hypothetical protein